MAVSSQERLSKPQENEKIENELAEWMKCRDSLIYFLKTYVFLQDRAKERTVPFESWEHLMNLSHLFLTEKHLIVLKARQLGVSWLIASYCLWKARFFENVKVLMLSQGEEEAFDLLAKCVFIDNHLPSFLKTTRNPDQRAFIGFPESGSEIRALPSTEKAGRSTDATVVVCDEWEYHPYAEQNFAALKPTVDAGGQFIAVSTADKTKLDTFFKQKYHEAMSGSGSFKKLFLSWRVRPGRTEEWFKQSTKDLRPWQAEQEYPNTEQEALSTLHSRKFFHENSLQILYGNVRQPIKHELSDKYKGLVRIYKPPVVGQKYLAFADPSDGKEDPHAIVVTNLAGEEQACSFGMTPADLCAQIFDELVRLYNNAFNSFELNARAGGIFSMKLEGLATPNIASSISANGEIEKKGKKGWWSSKPLWNKIIWNFEEAVRTLQITVYTKEALDEFNNFIVPEGEDPQKVRGAHDDFIDAWARVWFLRRYAKSDNTAKAFSFKYSES